MLGARCVCIFNVRDSCLLVLQPSISLLSPWMGTNYLLEREWVLFGMQKQVGDRAKNAISLGRAGYCQVSCRSVSIKGVLTSSQCFLKAVLTGSGSPEEISSLKREDVFRFLLFSSVVATEGAGMSILVPVVMKAKDGTWSFALLISRTTGLKYYQGRCDPCPSASSLQPRLRQSTQREPCQGCRMRFQWPLFF